MVSFEKDSSYIFMTNAPYVKVRSGFIRNRGRKMVPKLLFDMNRIDLNKIEYSLEEIQRVNPQRYEFQQLDGIYMISPDEGIIAGFKDVRDDEFWVRGHIPGYPLMPGALMIEAAAQLCSFYQGRVHPTSGLFGFGGLDGVKFRAAVRPGERLLLIGKAVQVTPRRSIFDAQGLVGEKLAFQGTITGIKISMEKLKN